jgi:hypothetical protein
MNQSVEIRTAEIVHVEWYDAVLLLIPLTLNPS